VRRRRPQYPTAVDVSPRPGSIVFDRPNTRP
jgi:hypothetical protein